MICKCMTFLDEPRLILLHTVKWLQVLLCITLTIQLNISYLFTHS